MMFTFQKLTYYQSVPSSTASQRAKHAVKSYKAPQYHSSKGRAARIVVGHLEGISVVQVKERMYYHRLHAPRCPL